MRLNLIYFMLKSNTHCETFNFADITKAQKTLNLRDLAHCSYLKKKLRGRRLAVDINRRRYHYRHLHRHLRRYCHHYLKGYFQCRLRYRRLNCYLALAAQQGKPLYQKLQ